LGRTSLVEHAIEATDQHPVQQALRHHPVAYMPLVDAYVQQIKDSGIVEPRAGSKWISNILLVCKKDGSLHYCIDHRGLNVVTQNTNYLLPCIDTCHDLLGGNIFYSSLDMHCGYWQVPVCEEDVDKTCFVTRKGIFGFKILLFGMCNAPSTFQHLVDMALAGLS